MDVIQAQLRTKRGGTIAVEIPTDEEMERIAMRMHAARKACIEEVLGWKVLYRPRGDLKYSTTSLHPFTGQQGDTHDHKSNVPAEFTFGYDADWKIVLMWRDGDDAPPVWFRYEDRLIRAPKRDTGQLF